MTVTLTGCPPVEAQLNGARGAQFHRGRVRGKDGGWNRRENIGVESLTIVTGGSTKTSDVGYLVRRNYIISVRGEVRVTSGLE